MSCNLTVAYVVLVTVAKSACRLEDQRSRRYPSHLLSGRRARCQGQARRFRAWTGRQELTLPGLRGGPWSPITHQWMIRMTSNFQCSFLRLLVCYNYIMGSRFLHLYLGFLLGIIPQPMTRWPVHHSPWAVSTRGWNQVSGASQTQTMGSIP